VTPADVAIGLALTAFGLLITFDSPSGQEGLWLDSVVIPAATLPVIWRRRAAVGAAAALAAGRGGERHPDLRPDPLRGRDTGGAADPVRARRAQRPAALDRRPPARAWALVFPVQTAVVHLDSDPHGNDWLYWVFNALILAGGIGLNRLGRRLSVRRRHVAR
jgi:hypothetical protein